MDRTDNKRWQKQEWQEGRKDGRHGLVKERVKGNKEEAGSEEARNDGWKEETVIGRKEGKKKIRKEGREIRWKRGRPI